MAGAGGWGLCTFGFFSERNKKVFGSISKHVFVPHGTNCTNRKPKSLEIGKLAYFTM